MMSTRERKWATSGTVRYEHEGAFVSHRMTTSEDQDRQSRYRARGRRLKSFVDMEDRLCTRVFSPVDNVEEEGIAVQGGEQLRAVALHHTPESRASSGTSII